jgi:hypothetical protein
VWSLRRFKQLCDFSFDILLRDFSFDILPKSGGPSEGRGSHAGVKARIREPSKGLTMGPNRKGKFDNESPEGKTGEQGVQPGMQGPAGGIKDVCRG